MPRLASAAVTIYPSLTYEDIEAALNFLEKAFGLTREHVETDERGAIRYAAVKGGEGLVLIQPDLPDELHGSHLGHGWVYVEVADPDAHYALAQAAGAEILGEPHDAMGGAMRGYSARDPEGNLWSFGGRVP